MVRWHDGDSTRAAGTRGEVGGIGAPATRPSRALWRVPGATQPSAWGDPPDTTPTGAGRGGGTHGHPLLAVGQAAGPRLWAGDAHLRFAAGAPCTLLPSSPRSQ